MKILVTGGCGFVGTNLINKLLKSGHKIISIDNNGLETTFKSQKFKKL